MRIWDVSSIVAFLLWCSPLAAGPHHEWKLGSGWHIRLELFGRGNTVFESKATIGSTQPPADGDVPRYDIHVACLGQDKVRGIDCFKIEFII